MVKTRLYLFLAVGLLAAACGNINPPIPPLFESDLPIDSLQLPPGFKLQVFAEEVKNARSLELSPNGTLFVGTRGEGKLYALRDENGDFRADTVYTLAEDLTMPNGVAFRNGSLYVAERSRILRYDDIEAHLDNPPEPVVIYDQYPDEKQHGWKYIAFGPDGKLYVPVGAPCNVCESEEEIFASLTRMDPDGSNFEIVQHGIRNTVGFTWHPETGELWFTDNGRDRMGDDVPYCELNRAPENGMHFGFPYCHQGDVPDPEFGAKRDCSEFTPPAYKLGPHVAPLGLEFYTADQFPAEYRGNIIIAEHGSWNRSKKSGYRLMMATLNGNEVVSYEPFIEGWLNQESDDVWGRPVDVELMPDGSLLISDDFADAIYRVTYDNSAM
ncbi:PQQ-dependent sugar dehydrogenase [Flavilitoribacter nigricans]|uniref:Sorbosone dehydrogenase n=1 Tax=Flavilitoribacter nigricans (strain ATCC 23147 / DSM 23189 / NBRC 102662 / NCIMB 1420 / SS-2) TaxID=1122177 RepID=A0A2D0N857_FLAN2|nr:sorbosone dehydrogenase [Flavilitoribacter nigricans DSM 23189 = NBRC 102662]